MRQCSLGHLVRDFRQDNPCGTQNRFPEDPTQAEEPLWAILEQFLWCSPKLRALLLDVIENLEAQPEKQKAIVYCQ